MRTAVWVREDDRAFATRLARYCVRNPVALERLTYDRVAKAVTYRSDTSDGGPAGTETVDPLEFLARVLAHSPDKGHVTARYDGGSANRLRGIPFRDAPAGRVGRGRETARDRPRSRAATAAHAEARRPPSIRGPSRPGQ